MFAEINADMTLFPFLPAVQKFSSVCQSTRLPILCAQSAGDQLLRKCTIRHEHPADWNHHPLPSMQCACFLIIVQQRRPIWPLACNPPHPSALAITAREGAFTEGLYTNPKTDKFPVVWPVSMSEAVQCQKRTSFCARRCSCPDTWQRLLVFTITRKLQT